MIIVPDSEREPAAHHAGKLARHAVRMFAAAGLVLFVGVLIDLGVLWILQRQDSPHWRFIALSATTNSYPPMLLSLVLLYGSLAIGRSTSLRAYRLVGWFALLLAGFAVAMGYLIGTNYLAIVRSATVTTESGLLLFKSQALKAGGLSLFLGGIVGAVGALGLRGPRR